MPLSVKFASIVALLAISLREIHGHGSMMDPVQRSSAWRKGFPVERNYDDNRLFCGGMNVQFEQNGGKCGVCGDDYALPRPRPNENGGTYGTGTIVRKYSRGQRIVVNVKLMVNHLGTFSFQLCPLKSSRELETEECFERYPLRLADGSYNLTVAATQTEFNVETLLPSDLVCEHCVLRWHYRGGDNLGECDDARSSAMGCGPQTTFRNCADVSIS